MNTSFSAFREDGSKVSLSDVLAVLPDNDAVWSILEFDGIGTAPDGSRMDEFERRARSGNGIEIGWAQLKAFASSLQDITECLIVCKRTLSKDPREQLDDGNLDDFDFVIDAADSTEWSIWARDTNVRNRVMTAFLL